ncbi:MAG: radical SAM protein [Elusimicrobia bacterium]|nr:radical SAM protein [Elusimicrobiota bacterium]
MQSQIGQTLKIKTNPCNVCPVECFAKRPHTQGFCGAKNLRIASANLHFGEEPVISGTKGSGTIFLSGCSLKCIFCQNYPISHFNNGRDIKVEELVSVMLELENLGAHNINFVTPTHFTLEIIEAVKIARKKGLEIPIVWNSSGYEKVETLKLLEEIVDIYMPDAKFGLKEVAKKYCAFENYPEVNKKALLEMKRQKGDLKMENGVAVRGLLIRHLVLPGEIENSKIVLNWIYENLGPVYLSLMSQYHPCHKAVGHPVIGRLIKENEYNEVLELADKLGFEGYRQII